MAQYVKNLTQFGFILALLLGMNAVAGEKEHKSIEQILSKPMPRWAFITSKFSAQSLVFAGAMAISMLGAYYYTVILFGSTPFDRFAQMNLLMFIWLLTFVAVTLVGSVIGSTTSTAAGIGLVGCVILLLSGSLPKVGQILPGGLATWIGQIGASITGAGVQGNWGAVAMALVIVLMGLLTSIAIFERQEL
jgi:ABC-2 type transport system permease protein